MIFLPSQILISMWHTNTKQEATTLPSMKELSPKCFTKHSYQELKITAIFLHLYQTTLLYFIRLRLKCNELMPVIPCSVTSKCLLTSLSSGLIKQYNVLTIKCNHLFYKLHKLSLRYNLPFQIFRNVTHPPGVFRENCKWLLGSLIQFCKVSG